jgi:hypothetical protein
MTTNQTDVESPAVVRGDDAYHLTPEGIKEPPKGWGPSLRYFGPPESSMPACSQAMTIPPPSVL